MTPVLHLTLRSVANRRFTTLLTLFSIALSVALLLGVERLRHDAREAFTQTISGTDLIVGARSGPVQLMLYSVFHIGDATNDISASSLDAVGKHRAVRWVVPLALGDSHRGHRVVGTTEDFFVRYHFGDAKSLQFSRGRSFQTFPPGLYEAVIGAEVANRLGYALGQPITLAHGQGDASLAEHADKPFQVVGILARTGTPVDRSVFVRLEAIEAIHLDWMGGAPMPGLQFSAEETRKFDLRPKRVTAALVGLKTRAAVFQVQRFINDYKAEPLLAILPGATLQDLWRLTEGMERSLLAISGLVVLVGLAGLIAVIVAGLGERRRELAILRALGAGPRDIFLLLSTESFLLTVGGCLMGVALLTGVSAVLAPTLLAQYGVSLSIAWPTPLEGLWLAAVVSAGMLASIIPAWRAYSLSLTDGMSVKT